MKKNFYKFALAVLGILGFFYSEAQTFEIRTVENDMGYLTVQMRETSGTGTPTTATNIVDITFVVRYPSGAVDMDLLCASNDYSIIDGLAGEQTFEGFDYHFWNGDISTPIHPPHDWAVNVWEDIAVFKATGDIGSGLFEIAPDMWDGRSLNWNQGGGDNTPTIDGSVTYSYPTVVYDYVWTGAANNYWDAGTNWIDECGGVIAVAPNSGNNCYIPNVANLPNNVNQGSAAVGGHQPTCDYLLIAAGASLTCIDHDVAFNVPALQVQLTYTVNNDLIIDGEVVLLPKSQFTVLGSTTMNSPEAIIVQADATGVGSFIDNGTITYGGSGSAKVQTYLSNAAGAGNFDIHLVGPTVDEENYTGADTGAFLEEFILDGAPTYAYEWDESVPNTADAWVNLNSLTDEIYSAMGIGLSTIDNTNHTLEMTGELITGIVSSPALTFSNNHYELISNPYPSAVDFDALYTANSGVVNNKFYLWDPSINNWIEYAGGAGGAQFIQVGQGFFVETHAGGTFDFTNNERTHSNVAFRETMANILNVNVEGGLEGYKDDIVIRFDEEATSGYDINLEAEFWESQNDDATSLRSLVDGNMEVAINVLPLESLNSGDMLSVPLMFTCGYDTEYAFTFSDIESFDLGTEIWLEDKLTGGDWISINNQPEYSFTGSPDDASDRFVLHFFGPTGTEEMDQPTIDLYASGPYAYVRNNTEETIQEIRIYSLSGALMNQVHTPDQKFLKLWVDDQVAYYVITVITDQQVYTKKLFISK